MNGAIKFHKATGPAFMSGEVWTAGNDACVIVQVQPYPSSKGITISDYEVTYRTSDGIERTNDAWNFQVRYTHHADKYV